MSIRERPILFTEKMVRAILEGRKTQTRRIIKPQPPDGTVDIRYRCPYARSPGDRLWVRETWALTADADACLKQNGVMPGQLDTDNDLSVLYRATDGECRLLVEHWRPSIHMPRWASRITLEVLKVKVERLQEISQADARAEGVDPVLKDVGAQAPGGYWYEESDYVEAFARLWDSINAKPKLRNKHPRTGARNICFVSYPWAEEYTCKDKGGLPWYVVGNPWVWVVEFKRVE